MENGLKLQIVKALEDWMQTHPNVSQNDVATSAEINPGYLIAMRKGDFKFKAGNNIVDIADKYFIKLAKFVGFELESNYWPTRKTIQLHEIITNLNSARQELETTVIIGQTGTGKTFALDLFKSKFPTEVFTVKAGSSDKLNDLIGKVLLALGVPQPRHTVSGRISQIVLRLKIIREKGFLPVLGFDEAEYMKYSALCAFKELFDLLNKECALVLIGTEELIDNIEKMIRCKKPGIAQLFRRIKFKIFRTTAIDTRFQEFLENVAPDVKRWLQTHCENYGELRDVMVPVLSEAARLQRPVSLELLKLVLGIPQDERELRKSA